MTHKHNHEDVRDEPIAQHDLELDKTPAGWILTAWPTTVAPTVLRLRLPEYLSVEDPFDLILEARFGSCTEFSRVAVLDTCAESLLRVSGREDGWSGVPVPLRPAFLTMTRTLGAILWVTELGGTPPERYPGEPLTSRDYFYFGAADDLPRQTKFEKHHPDRRDVP